jgi:hypothetical protein
LGLLLLLLLLLLLHVRSRGKRNVRPAAGWVGC